MSSTKPTIVFGPGAWHTPDCFDLVRNELASRGWSVEAIDYPSVGAEPPTKSLSDDARVVREALQRLADEGKPIVLVVHSYGGLVGANAVEGLGYKQRAQQGKAGGVIMFVYLAAFVTPRGKCILEMLGGKPLPWMNFKASHIVSGPEDIQTMRCTTPADPLATRKIMSTRKHPRSSSTMMSKQRLKRRPLRH